MNICLRSDDGTSGVKREAGHGNPGRSADCRFEDVHGEDGGTAADIENNLVLKDVLVLGNGVHVRSCAHLVFLQCGRAVSGVLHLHCAVGEGCSIPTSPRGCLLQCEHVSQAVLSKSPLQPTISRVSFNRTMVVVATRESSQLHATPRQGDRSGGNANNTDLLK